MSNPRYAPGDDTHLIGVLYISFQNKQYTKYSRFNTRYTLYKDLVQI